MKLLLLLGILFCGVACNQVKTYTIEGHMPGAADGVVVRLADLGYYPEVILDSTIIKEEKFVLKGKQPLIYPKYCKLIIDKTPQETDGFKKQLKACSFFVDNSRIRFECQIDSMPSYYWEPVSKEHNVTLSGSPTQDLYNQYQGSVRELTKRSVDLWNKYLEVYHRPAIDGIFNTEEGMQIVREREVITEQINQEALKFIRNNKASVVGVFVANRVLNRRTNDMTVSEIKAVVDNFDSSVQESELMDGLRKTAERMYSMAKGVKYHDIELTDLKGEKVKLSEFVKPGVYNMLEFWASWCGPCRGEIPHLRHLYQSGGKENLNMISISIDERDADWKKAVQEENMEWIQLCDQKGFNGEVNSAYQIRGVPFCLILDPEGKIVSGGVRGAELDAVVKDLLGDKIKL